MELYMSNIQGVNYSGNQNTVFRHPSDWYLVPGWPARYRHYLHWVSYKYFCHFTSMCSPFSKRRKNSEITPGEGKPEY
jgi:hypothetical protein